MSSLPRLLADHSDDDVVAYGPDGEVSARRLRGGSLAIMEALGPAKSGEEVLIICRDSYRFAASLMGALRAGYRIGVPPNAQPETIVAFRHREGVKTVVHDTDIGLGIDVRPMQEASATMAALPRLYADEDAPLVTVYTSGSTGEPKACSKSARQLIGEAATLARAFPSMSGRVACTVPPHHIYGLLFGVLTPLVSGGAFRRSAPVGPWEMLRAAEQSDVLVSVPAQLRMVLKALDQSRDTWARVFSSGAALPQDVARGLGEAGFHITEVLGSSETGGIAHRHRGASPPGSFTPFDGVEISLDGADGNEGALVVDSPLIAPDQRPLTTSDRVRLEEDGRFTHLGRVDGVVKVGSTRTSLEEVRGLLLAIDGVHEAAVIDKQVGGARGTELWAVIASAPGHSLSKAQLRNALSKRLQAVVIPRRFRFVDALPRTSMGKVRRADLLALFEREEGS